MKSPPKGMRVAVDLLLLAVLAAALVFIARCECTIKPTMWTVVLAAVCSSVLLAVRRNWRAADALFEHNERYRKMIEAAQEGIWLLDKSAKTTFVNECMANMLGYTAKEMLGRPIFDFVAESSKAEAGQHLDRSSESSSDQRGLRLRRKDGSDVWVLMNTGQMYDAAGKASGSLAMVVDLTERKKAEDHLLETTQDLRSILNAADGLMACPDVDTLFREAIELARIKLGLERCAIFVVEGDELRGTYGTDRYGRTTCEHAQRFTTETPVWHKRLQSMDPQGPRWDVAEEPRLEWDGEKAVEVGRGWVAITPIRADSGHKLIGVMVNDAAITGADVDPMKQEVATVFCATLGSIIAQKRAEEALRESEAIHRQVIEAAGGVPYRLRYGPKYGAGTYEFLGVGSAKLTGIQAEDMTHERFGELTEEVIITEPSGTPDPHAAFKAFRRGELPRLRTDCRLRTPQGEVKWVSDCSVPLRDEQTGEVVGSLGVLMDITERKQIEEAVRRERDFAETLVETAQAIVLVLDTDGRIVRFNPYMEEVSGYKLEEVRGKDWFSTFLPERDHAQIRELFRTAVGDIQTCGNVNPIVTKDGCERLIEWHDKTLKDAEGHVVGLLAVGQDITERKGAEDALERSERLYRGAIEAAGAVAYYRNYDTNTFEFVSPAIEPLTGYSPEEFTPEVWDSLMREVVPRGDLEGLSEEEAREAMKSGDANVWRADYRIVARDGSERWVANAAIHIHDDPSAKLASLGIFQDITERTRLDEHLREATKMESVGRLAGGIAHEFNNMLMGILGYAHFAQEGVRDADQAADLAEIRKLADRARILTRQLLAFGRKQRLEMKVLDLNAQVKRLCQTLPQLVGEHIDVEFALAPGLAPVCADPSQIGQVLMGLAANARDAMPRGGALSIQTSSVELDEAQVKTLAELAPGPYVELRVADTGCGMDKETLGRIFEPFFTTKEVGEGTGLGLASVYGIIKQHGGGIHVESEPAQGTTFHIYFPPAADDVVAAAQKAQADPAATGDGTILVVEDEETVRRVVARSLAERGYKVLIAANAEEAEDVLAKESRRVDLLLTDMVMPGANGHALYQRLVARYPKLKVLFMSGYDDRSAMIRDVSNAGLPFIHKPMDMGDLATRVREVLAGPRE